MTTGGPGPSNCDMANTAIALRLLNQLQSAPRPWREHVADDQVPFVEDMLHKAEVYGKGLVVSNRQLARLQEIGGQLAARGVLRPEATP